MIGWIKKLMRRIRWAMACKKAGNFCLLCPHYREEDEKHRSWIGYDCHWEEDTRGGER